MNDATQRAQYAAQYAAANYDEQIDAIAKKLIDFAGELKRAYGSHRWDDEFSTPADVGSWAINHLTSNLMSNLRIDLLSKYAHEAAVAHADLARAQKVGV